MRPPANTFSRSMPEHRTSSPHIDPKTGAKTIDLDEVARPRSAGRDLSRRVRRQGLAADVLQPADRAALSAADRVVQPHGSGRQQAAHLGRGTEPRGASRQQRRHDGPAAGDGRQGPEAGVGAPSVGSACRPRCWPPQAAWSSPATSTRRSRRSTTPPASCCGRPGSMTCPVRVS